MRTKQTRRRSHGGKMKRDGSNAFSNSINDENNDSNTVTDIKVIIPTSDDNTQNIYGPDTVISIHTSRPVDNAQVNHLFWCDLCDLKLDTAHKVIAHCRKKNHKRKQNCEGENSLKRKLDDTDVSAVIKQDTSIVENLENKAKHVKTEPEIRDATLLKCEACGERTFASATLALQHFKGKQHTSKIEGALKQRMSAEFRCDNCNKDFTTPHAAIQHYKSRNHAMKITGMGSMPMGGYAPPPMAPYFFNYGMPAHAANYGNQFPNDGMQHGKPAGVPKASPANVCVDAGADAGKRSCDICCCTFTSDTDAGHHFAGRKHIAKVNHGYRNKNRQVKGEGDQFTAAEMFY